MEGVMLGAEETRPAYDLPPGYDHIYSGKVRELYRSPEGRLLFVATDRISAYDWILETPIPDKGRILTQLSLWWFDQFADIVPNHVLSTRVPDAVAGRALLCQELDMMPVECVVRGFLAGSMASPRDCVRVTDYPSRCSRPRRRPRRANTTRTSPMTRSSC